MLSKRLKCQMNFRLQKIEIRIINLCADIFVSYSCQDEWLFMSKRWVSYDVPTSQDVKNPATSFGKVKGLFPQPGWGRSSNCRLEAPSKGTVGSKPSENMKSLLGLKLEL